MQACSPNFELEATDATQNLTLAPGCSAQQNFLFTGAVREKACTTISEDVVLLRRFSCGEFCKLLNGELLCLRRHTDTPILRHQPFVVAAPPRHEICGLF